ncbi:hypothetical protein KY320_02395 [Candidatus Woesearchaeota archaeon]|nr:hypothetical protein [Candidatus Woesearchaeota archaeon]
MADLDLILAQGAPNSPKETTGHKLEDPFGPETSLNEYILRFDDWGHPLCLYAPSKPLVAQYSAAQP